MINIFRKKRKSLADDNKALKYTRYAIGEIVLVVIGILIALSINNWNENRKLENSKQKLMLALKQEFLINKNTLQERINGLHKHNSNLNKVVNFSAGSIELPIDSLRLYSSNLAYQTRLSMLNSVLEEAISSGKFEMLSDSLKQKLSILKDYIKSRNEINKINDEFVFNRNGSNKDFIMILGAFQESPYDNFLLYTPITKHPEFILSDEEFINYIKSSEAYSKIYQVYYFGVIDEVWIKYGLLRFTNEIIDLIDNELNLNKV